MEGRLSNPQVISHDGVLVVRDDLFAGGTKARFLRPALKGLIKKGFNEFVYASPVEGGAQTSLAVVAKELNVKATIFLAQRSIIHPRVALGYSLKAQMISVKPGYLNVVQSRARSYSKQNKKAYLMPFGMDVPEAVDIIAAAATSLNLKPDEVWCAAGSGTLARGLIKAWPQSTHHVVQIGRELKPEDVPGAIIHIHPLAFSNTPKSKPPFPSDLHYDAKAWEICCKERGNGCVLFWNVIVPPQ